MKNVKNISIKQFLAGQGIDPKYERGRYGMYLSPLRSESTPSFKVDYNANLWYDFGTGEGGSIIDLVARMENCSIAEAIRRLEDSAPLSFHREEQKPIAHREEPQLAAPSIRITDVRPLTDPRLLEYLTVGRSIDLAIAREYCREVHYTIGGREYFAIGFRNDAGGWELRNPRFKGSSTPKNITTFSNGSDTVMVFEGFIDFFSYLSLKRNPSPTIDTAVLNSVANLGKAVPFLAVHRTIHAFLDNDDAGRRALAEITRLIPIAELVDQSAFYRQHKDLNDYWRDRSQRETPIKNTPPVPKVHRQTTVEKKKSGMKL